MKPNVWEVVKNEDDTFDILHKDKVVHSSIPDRWLEEQLAEHGFCGEEYREIRRQLDQHGKARIVL